MVIMCLSGMRVPQLRFALERERERERERRERERERDRETERQTDRQTDRQRHRDRDRLLVIARFWLGYWWSFLPAYCDCLKPHSNPKITSTRHFKY